jgi:WD40 repeat protein
MKIVLLSLVSLSAVYASSVPGAANVVPEYEMKDASNKRKPAQSLEHEGAKKQRIDESAVADSGHRDASGDVVMGNAAPPAPVPHVVGKPEKEEKVYSSSARAQSQNGGASSASASAASASANGASQAKKYTLQDLSTFEDYDFDGFFDSMPAPQNSRGSSASASASASAGEADVKMGDAAREQKQKAAQGHAKNPYKGTNMEALVGNPTELQPELLSIVAGYLDSYEKIASEGLYSHAIRVIEELPDGRLAIGSDEGLCRVWSPGMQLTDVVRIPIQRDWSVGGLPSIRQIIGLSNNKMVIMPVPSNEQASSAQEATVWDTQLKDQKRPLARQSQAVYLLRWEGDKILLWSRWIWDPLSNPTDSKDSLPDLGIANELQVTLKSCRLRDGRVATPRNQYPSDKQMISVIPVDNNPAVLRTYLHTQDVKEITALQESADGRLVSALEDGTIKIWDLSAVVGRKTLYNTGQSFLRGELDSSHPSVVTIPSNGKPVIAMQVLRNGLLAVLSKTMPVAGGTKERFIKDGVISIWDISDRNRPQRRTAFDHAYASCLRALRDGGLAIGSSTGEISIWKSQMDSLMAQASPEAAGAQ